MEVPEYVMKPTFDLLACPLNANEIVIMGGKYMRGQLKAMRPDEESLESTVYTFDVRT